MPGAYVREETTWGARPAKRLGSNAQWHLRDDRDSCTSVLVGVDCGDDITDYVA